ncbi:hypothetical protein TDB9533_00695 [Thalassocella blandensis]|nr:hypothetical protein TDB9533_00695 [Thalassocella blandensis]
MIKKLILTIVLMGCSIASAADILVIVNADSSVDGLTHKQAVDLFMGRVTAFPNNKPAVTLDLETGTPLRAHFYKALTGKSEAQVDAYWATLVFAGRMTQPKQYDSEQTLIQTVADNSSAIAYVDKQPLPANVKVVLELPSEE